MISSSVPPRKPQVDQTIADQLAAGILVGSIWRSRRGRHFSLQASIRTYRGSKPYLDLRVFELDASGCVRPSQRGVTISISNIFELLKLIASAQRKAVALGLATDREKPK